MKKRPHTLIAPQDFDAAGPNGSATAAEEVSMESPQPPEAGFSPATADTAPAPDEPSLAATTPEPPAALSLTLAPDTNDSLEQRVRRLETAVKEIQETRVTDRPAKEPPLAAPPLDFMVPSVAAPPAPPPPPVAPPEKKRTWLLAEMWSEARAIRYMFFDPRYRMSWGGRFIPLLLLAAFLTAGFWLPGTGIEGVGRVLQKAAELVLGFALFKALSHEARRYRDTAPDLPPSWRL